MSRPAAKQPIIIVKKKVQAAGHHGGAWKVAYADFVTAMMALFIVLWLLSSSESVQKVVGGYFTDPSGNGREMGSTRAGMGDSLKVSNEEDMEKLKERIAQAMQSQPKLKEMGKSVKITVTTEGLRIELLETVTGMFFELGNAKPTKTGEDVLGDIAKQITGIPNAIVIEGHTDAKPYGEGAEYTNWELSSDRANAARRVLMKNGLPSNRIAQVRGYADQNLRDIKDPLNPANRRVTIIVKFSVDPKEANKENLGS